MNELYLSKIKHFTLLPTGEPVGVCLDFYAVFRDALQSKSAPLAAYRLLACAGFPCRFTRAGQRA